MDIFSGEDMPELLGRAPAFLRPSKYKKAAKTTLRIAKRGVRATGHVFATTGRAIGHGVAEAARVSNRVIKRTVRGVARKILLHGDPTLGVGSYTTMSKNAAVAAVTTGSALAVGAVFTPAIAAGAAPVIAIAAKEAVDEIYSQVKKKIAGGKTPAQAEEEVDAEFKEDPGFSQYLIPVGIGIFALLYLTGRKKSPQTK